MKPLFILNLLLSATLAHANLDWTAVEQKQNAVLFGHNLTNTSYLLAKGDCSVGSQAVICGVGEKTMVGVTPFLALLYNMVGAYVRQGLDSSNDKSSAVQLAYFKTDSNTSRSSPYEMEGAWLSYLQSWWFNIFYTMHVTSHLAYYANDKSPFSLRRVQGDRVPVDVTISTLHEMSLIQGIYILGEIGILGLNRKIPEVQIGHSVGMRFKNWLFHIGYSVSATPSALFSTKRVDCGAYFRTQPTGYDTDMNTCAIEEDFAMHPEMVIQYYF